MGAFLWLMRLYHGLNGTSSISGPTWDIFEGLIGSSTNSSLPNLRISR